MLPAMPVNPSRDDCRAVAAREHGGACRVPGVHGGYDSLYGWVGNFTMLIPTAACFACAWRRWPAPGARDLARARDALADGRQRGGLDLGAVPGQPARPLALGFLLLRVLHLRDRRDRLPRAPRPRVLPAGALARWRARRRGRRDRPGRRAEPGALGHPGRPRHRARRRDLHDRGPAPRRDDRRPAHRPRPARGIDVAVDGRWPRPLLRRRRRVRPAHHRRHLRGGDLAVPLVDGRGLVHRLRDLAAATTTRDRVRPLEADPGDPDAGHPDRGRRARDLLLQPAARSGRGAGDLHAAACRGADVHELPPRPAPLRRPPPGGHRRAHRPGQPALPLRARPGAAVGRGRHRPAGADPDRPRQLQGDQRHLRPPGRRQAAARDRAAPRGPHGRPRPARPARRRRVRAPDHARPGRRRRQIAERILDRLGSRSSSTARD